MPSQLNPSEGQPYEPLLQSGDRLTISVWGHDELSVGSSFAAPDATEASGKFIALDARGAVILPLLGEVKLAGLTVREADLYLSKRYEAFLQEPIVKVRVLNHQVTVMGEVKSPGTYRLDEPQTDLLAMLARAGGPGDYAQLREVQLIRRTPGQAWQSRILDLTRLDSLQTQPLWLQAHDLIYVPARQQKALDKFTNRLVPVAGLIGSVVLLISVTQSNRSE